MGVAHTRNEAMSTEAEPAFEAFLRLVEERFNGLKSRLKELVAVLSADDKQQKLGSAAKALKAAKTLQQALAQRDQPAWLAPLIQALQNYVSHEGQHRLGAALLEAIGLHYRAMVDHQWAFASSDGRGFDFDAVFHKYEAESNLSDLFDELVELLEKIVECEDVDSRRMIHTLEIMIATLKKNRKGSFFAIMGTWNFVGTYLRNVAWNALSDIPGLRVLVTSLRETLDQVNAEMNKMHENMRSDLRRQLQADFPALEYQQLSLPAPLPLEVDTVAKTAPTSADREEA
jgi:hypothetical protein